MRRAALIIASVSLLLGAGCALNVEEDCDLTTCDTLCRGAGYVSGQCLGSECHCSYDMPGNSNWNPWATPDAGDLCGGCPEGQLCCGGTCQEVEFDNANCGVCGRVCGENEECINGWCTCGGVASCIEGSEKCCNDECVNILYDPTNCGGCGSTCEDDTGPECYEGECVCPSPPIYGDPRACEGTYEDMCCPRTLLTMGGCFDLGNDREHCNACDISCAVFEGQICILGQCTESLN